MSKSGFTARVRAFVIFVILAVSVYFYFSRKPPANPATKSAQELAIESKGLPEFDAGNNKTDTLSPRSQQTLNEMSPILTLIGDGKDLAKNKEAITALGNIIEKYPKYSDAYFLRATVAMMSDRANYQQVLSDIDRAIQLQSSAKSENVVYSSSDMYTLRAKVDMIAGNDQQAVSDIETAIKADPTANFFNNGGVKPEDDTNPTALQKGDFDALVTKYPDDYRVYMFRGLFYRFFATFDEQYYTPALSDLERAQSLDPNSAFVDYFLGIVYQKEAFWTMAAAADISESGGYRDKTNAIALQYFTAAVKLDPAFTEAWAQVTESLYRLRRYSEAISAYDKEIELDPNRFGAYNDRGLAKTYTGDSYGAISDFSKAIEVSERSKTDSSLDDTYASRADAYGKVGDFQGAIADYSKAIGIKFSSQVFLMSVPQIRAIYPELKDIPDQTLLEGFRQKYYPNMKPTDFYGQYAKNNKPFEDFVIAGLYESRGDSYLHAGSCKSAAAEYARAVHADSTYVLNRWKVLSKDADAEFSIDSQTLNCSQGNTVFVWLKSTRSNSEMYDETNYQIDCSSGRMKVLGSATYNSSGNPVNTRGEQEWEVIIPESIGETLRNSVCPRPSGPQ